jgi:hypothetical protein
MQIAEVGSRAAQAVARPTVTIRRIPRVGADRAVLAGSIAIYAAVFLYRLSHAPDYGQQYSIQALSWLMGRLDIAVPIAESDFTVWNGRVYLPIPFLPTILVLPFVAVWGLGIYEVLVSPLVGVLNVLAFQRVCVRAGCAPGIRPWLVALFGVGSLHLYAVAAGTNWYLSHLLATTCLLWLLWEAFGRGRGPLLGLAVALASLSRPSAWFALPYALLAGWAHGRTGRRLALHACAVALGVMPVLGVWCWYNWARFGNPLQTGYSLITVPPCIDVALKTHGTFSAAYIPKNLYLMLLHGPEPVTNTPVLGPYSVQEQCTSTASTFLNSPQLDFPWLKPSEWGMGLLYTTPALLFAVTSTRRERWSAAAWVAIASILAVTMTYYSPGWIQFGYRYSLDFLPFLLVLMARGMADPPSRAFKGLVVFSVLVEVWGISVTVLS